MPETIFIGVAWPYANGSLHLGQIAGAYLPPDIFARYHRIAGNRVLMVSGSDQHGTPITVRAEQEGTTPQAIVDRFQAEFLESWSQLGISFDLYTTTGTKNHDETVHEMFLACSRRATSTRARCCSSTTRRPGASCPTATSRARARAAATTKARGDQCDNCGSTLDADRPDQPREPLHRHHAGAARVGALLLQAVGLQRAPRGVALDRQGALARPRAQLLPGLGRAKACPTARSRATSSGASACRSRTSARASASTSGSKPSSATSRRPRSGRSAQGTPEAWRDFWEDPDCKTYYFIGKDNIFFHTIIWPAWLMAYGGLNQPYDVPANQYLNFGGAKASTSQGTAPFLPDLPRALRPRHDPLLPGGDHARDQRHRVQRGRPRPAQQRGAGRHLGQPGQPRADPDHPQLRRPRARPGRPRAAATKSCSRRATTCSPPSARASPPAASGRACRRAFRTRRRRNRYLNQEEPWKAISEGRRADAARALYTALGAIEALKLALYPYLPFSSGDLHAMLGHDDAIGRRTAGWRRLAARSAGRRRSAGRSRCSRSWSRSRSEVPA